MILTFEERMTIRQVRSELRRARVSEHESCAWCCNDFYPDERHKNSQRFCSASCQKCYWSHQSYREKRRRRMVEAA